MKHVELIFRNILDFLQYNQNITILICNIKIHYCCVLHYFCTKILKSGMYFILQYLTVCVPNFHQKYLILFRFHKLHSREIDSHTQIVKKNS